jgi:hypothetical protein
MVSYGGVFVEFLIGSFTLDYQNHLCQLNCWTEQERHTETLYHNVRNATLAYGGQNNKSVVHAFV